MKKQKISKVSRYQNLYSRQTSLDTIAEEATLYGQSMRQSQRKQIQVQQQNQYKVLEAILLDTHQHLECCPIQILISMLEGAQKQEDNHCYEAFAIIQNITQAHAFKMLIKGIQCQKCCKSFLFNVINKYNKILKLILYHQRHHLSSLQDYKWFLKLNELLLRNETNKILALDSIWNQSIRQLIEEQQQNFKIKYTYSKKVNSFVQINQNQKKESIDKQIRAQLRIHQMSLQLLKLYLNENKKIMVNFYDKYIRHSNPIFLLTIGKLINCTYNKVQKKDTNSQFQFQIVLPLTKKIQNSNTGLRFQFKPPQEIVQKPMQVNTVESTNVTNLSPSNQKVTNITSKQITLQQVASKSQEKNTALLNTISLKTVEQLQSLFDQLLNKSKKDQQKKHKKQQIVTSLKDLKIKNLKGSKQKKIQMVNLFLDVSSRQPALVGSAFQNGLIYFDISQLPKKIKEYYQSSPQEVKEEYEKQRKKRRIQLKVLYDSFKID